MQDYHIRKLERFTKLSAADKAVLQDLARSKVLQAGAREDIVREGDSPEYVNLLREGFACRYKYLEDGRRQIISFFVPGDLCDVHTFILKAMDHSIGAITPVTVARIPRDTMLSIFEAHPRITRALWWHTLVEEAILREATVNLGQRSGIERVAHLLCEVYVRLDAVGLVENRVCPFPFTQSDLSDALGLTAVYTNQMLQNLRKAELITLRSRTLEIRDLERLRQIALFNPNYLHLEREGREYDSNERDVA